MTFVAMGTAAAIGAGTSALTGGDEDDILKAAILGGITGGITGGVTGTEGLTPEVANVASPELLNAAPEVMTTAAPEGILQAQPLQLANAPTVTSDIGQYNSDRAIAERIQNYPPGPETRLSPEVLQASGNLPTPTTSTINANSSSFLENDPSNQSSLGRGFEKALGYMEKYPLPTMMVGYAGLNALGAFNPNSAQMPDRKYSGSLSKYRMSPNFQPSRVTPNVYTPRYAAQGGIMTAGGGAYEDEPMGDAPGMVAGGIASYSRGRTVRRVSAQDELDDYMKMMEGETIAQAPAPSYVGTTGIIPLDNINTRGKDSLTASMIRMGEAGSRANYTPYKKMKRPNALGGINLSAPGVKKEEASASDDEREAAAGGIMQADRYNMGGYASGSVPRLLKGPGDGMSDDIPASIDNRQPARLADGEFVIPADVVSHLGNGSTEAGAKKLHKMMTDLRKDRTGNPKQGKQIVAEKYLPKKSRKA
jgi:hypothetical protein